jgi:acetoin utilization deacetylase AcuC-like enzyme
MSTAFLTHPDCLRHVTPVGHPERVARLEVILERLKAPEFSALVRAEAPLGREADILRCHPQSYVDHIRQAEPAEGTFPLDADTHMSPGSFAAALRAVGGATRAVDMVLGGEAGNAFAAIRPPGHHAEQEKPMGFCLFGNVAIAAKYALDHHGLNRVAIVDFDVHHGNGTQALLWDEPRVRFVSSHQMPLWPGTGARDERGAHDNIRNVPLAPESGGAEARAVYEAEVFPWLDDFAPELVLVSAGFDAHARDPLAQLMWREEDFAWITGRLCDLAEAHAGGKLVSTLEGGYDLQALAASVAAHVTVLMERGG